MFDWTVSIMLIYIIVRENRRGQSRMDNPDTLETLGSCI